MTNPLAQLHEVVRGDQPYGASVSFWCPGCEAAHRVGVVSPTNGSLGDGPCWEWNGALDETITVSPSILCHSSVHLCAGEHEPVVCADPSACGETGHLILNAERGSLTVPEPEDRVLGHNTPHTRDPAWGSCHSFLRSGRWEFLGDSAHRLAGQTVPMVPMPDWLVR